MSQHLTNKKPKLSHKTESRLMESPTPGPRGKLPDQNIPYQQIFSEGDIPQPGPMYGEGLRTVNLEILDTPPTTRPDSQNPATRGEVEGEGTELPVELTNFPSEDPGALGQSEGVRLDQLTHENTCFSQSILNLQHLGSKAEDAVVGVEKPGGDPTLKPNLVDQEIGPPLNEEIPEQNISCQQKPIGGDTPQPSPVFGDDLSKTNLMMLDFFPTNGSDPQALTTRGKGERADTDQPGGDSPVEHPHNSPTYDLELGCLENETTNFPQTMLTFLRLSQGRVDEVTSLLSELIGTPLTTEMTCTWLSLEFQSKAVPYDLYSKLIDCISEDPADHPASFVPIIEKHNARLAHAHLLHEATRHIIEQKWAEGRSEERRVGKECRSRWSPYH